MSRASLMASLHPFVDKPVLYYVDMIKTIAERHRYSVNIIDPEFNVGSIDNDESRLNVRTDKDGVIKSFSIG